MIEALCSRFGVEGPVRAAALAAQDECSRFTYPAQTRAKLDMLAAFLEEGLAEHDLWGTTGYGYGDAAREHYESLICKIFATERALARLSFASGTQAIVTALAACTPPGRTLLSITGKPYDTLRNAIVTAPNALTSQGIAYRETPFPAASGGGPFDLTAIERELEDERVATVFLQRSRGYAPRPSANVAACEAAIGFVKARRPDVAVLVDNCYGELVEDREPTHAGADLVMGSLIKNLGGALAPTGGYVAGRGDLVERVAARHYAPGLGDALGPTLGIGRALLQGLFVAPAVIEQTLRGLDFAAALFTQLGYAVDPPAGEPRTDIVQAIRLGSADRLRGFAEALQGAMPVNARFRPQPGAVPGYVDPVIMSSGAFVSGATIELSCDAPLREPFEVYLQGGIVAEHTMLGAVFAARAVHESQRVPQTSGEP